MFSTAAASGANVCAVSSWKLDSSSTQTSGSAVLSIASRQLVEHRRADVARHRHLLAGAFAQQAGERGRRGLAVGAGDRDHLRRVAVRAKRLQRLREQFEFAPHRDAAFPRGVDQRPQVGGERRQARADRDDLDAAIEQRRRERAADEIRIDAMRLRARTGSAAPRAYRRRAAGTRAARTSAPSRGRIHRAPARAPSDFADPRNFSPNIALPFLLEHYDFNAT